MDFRKMNRTELDMHLKNLIRKEREILHLILETIREIDSRRMYLEMGYSSLFDYLTQAVGYSNASAQRRIDAARLLAEIPNLCEKIQSGELKLNQISMVQKATRDAAKQSDKKVTIEEKIVLLETISNQSVQQTQKEIANFFDLPVEHFTKQTTQADESVRIEITLSKEAYEKLQRAQALISGAVPERDLVRFVEYVSEKIIQQRTSARSKVKDSLVAKSRGSAKLGLPARSFSSPPWKKVAHGKQSCCQYKDPTTGRVCESKWFLQVDHKQPQWAFGSNDPGNLQILCAAHNRLKYRKEAGISLSS